MPRHYYDTLFLEEEPKWVRFVAGDYKTSIYIPEKDKMVTISLPFYRYKRHYDPSGKVKYLPCSGGDDPDFRPQPCVGCSKGLGIQEAYAHTVVHLDWFHKVPWIKNSEVQIDNRTGQAIKILRPCEGEKCPMCRSDAERVFGRKLHLALPFAQQSQLRLKTEQLTKYCGCGEEISIAKLTCPQCESVLIDMETTDLTTKEIKENRKNGMGCSTCKRHMQVVDEYDCECGNARTISMYDVDANISKTRVSEKTSIIGMDFAKPGPIDERYEGGVEPFDFAEVFAPPNVESQRLIYNYRGPITNVGEEDVAEKY